MRAPDNVTNTPIGALLIQTRSQGENLSIMEVVWVKLEESLASVPVAGVPWLEEALLDLRP